MLLEQLLPPQRGEYDEKAPAELPVPVLTGIERSGDAFLSTAMVNGRFALRACIVNFRTSMADIEALPHLLARLGRDTDATLRG